MKFFRRSLIALGVAATLPTIVFGAVGAFYFLRAERSQIETETLRRSSTVVNLSDASLRADVRALNMLASSVYFESLDWANFHPRLQRTLVANPHWLTLRIYDLEHAQEIFNVARDLAPPHPAALPGTESAQRLAAAMEPVIGGITMEEEPVVHVYVPVRRDGTVRFVLVASVRATVFQDILLSQVPKSTIAAVVDRHGNFVARTHDYAKRVGQPATQVLRDATSTGLSGFYRGVTYEGFRNYTAFQTSPWSGWSTHVAVASTLIDTPTSWSFVVAGIAGLGSAALAAILVLLVLRDMAERRRADEALRQSQKMEAVGQLTGGIAHDFNNLLTAIIGNLDMIRNRVEGNEKVQRLADNALEAARRGAKVTSQLLAFSRSQRMQLATVDLDRLLDGMGALLHQSAGPAISVRISVAPDARYVTSDANQIELALLNLVVNARDAMPAGGSLSISTHRVVDLDLRELQRRPYVEIRVSDTGSGMPDEIRARAIEPFFTTKRVGHGTGLGLSQVYGVMRESGGTLLIDSEVGQGTTIRMVLPAATTPSVSEYIAHARSHPRTVPTPRDVRDVSILIVDDDRQVRRFITESLRTLGYRVTDIDNGAGALELLDAQPFDLLIADFAMPGMNGAEVARAAQQRRKELRVLMVSGYADSATIETMLGAIPLLRKPFDSAALGEAVAEVLKAEKVTGGG
jgi:signal transduction histidine kinase